MTDRVEPDAGKDSQPEGGHTAALQADSYQHTLNKPTVVDGVTVASNCEQYPSLTSLTIDTKPGDVVIYAGTTDKFDHQKYTTDKLEISEDHYRKDIRDGLVALQDGRGFNLAMRNALSMANQSDMKENPGKHTHLDKLLAYVNGELCGTNFTLTRTGNKLEYWDTRESTKKPFIDYDLKKNDFWHGMPEHSKK